MKIGLKIGSHGDDVTMLQQALGVTPTGVFTRQLQSVVMRYQVKHRLHVTGEWDAATAATYPKAPSVENLPACTEPAVAEPEPVVRKRRKK